MIIDAHAHFEPLVLDVPDLIREMDQLGIAKAFLVPRMTSPPEPEKPGWVMAIQRLLFTYNSLRPIGIGITKLMYLREGEWNLGPFKYLMNAKSAKLSIVTEPENQMVDRICSLYPERFKRWHMLNLNDSLNRQDLASELNGPNVIGIKLHPFWHKFSLQKFAEIADLLAPLGLPYW